MKQESLMWRVSRKDKIMANDFVNMKQIAVFKNNKVLIEFNDEFKRAQLTSDEVEALKNAKDVAELPKKQFSKIHDKYSGIEVVAQDYANGTGDKLIRVNLRITPENAKMISDRVKAIDTEKRALLANLENEKSAYEQSAKFFKAKVDETNAKLKDANLSPEDREKLTEQLSGLRISFGTAQANYYSVKKRIEAEQEYVEVIFNEQKIMPSLIAGTNYSKVTLFKIEYNAKMRNPWTIYVENGKGIKESTSTGGSKIKSGTYCDKKTIKLYLVADEMERIFNKVADYSLAWEIVNINGCLKDRASIEKVERELWEKNPENHQNHN